jgi:hypothetical protein
VYTAFPVLHRVLTTSVAQAIQYSDADHQPTLRQIEDGVATLTRGLAPFALTKAEKLQVSNLAPTEPVELCVVSFFFIYILLANTLNGIFAFCLPGCRRSCCALSKFCSER